MGAVCARAATGEDAPGGDSPHGWQESLLAAPGPSRPTRVSSSSSTGQRISYPSKDEADDSIVGTLELAIPEIDNLGETELHYLQNNPLSLDDIFISSSVKQVSGAVISAVENAELAESRLRTAAALLSRKADIVQQRTSDRLETVFAARAKRSEAEAETILQEALEAPGTMDEASVAEFRQRYIGLQIQKHTRLALKELAGPPPHARRPVGDVSTDRPPGLPRAASAGLERLKQGHQWSSTRSSSSEWHRPEERAARSTSAGPGGAERCAQPAASPPCTDAFGGRVVR